MNPDDYIFCSKCETNPCECSSLEERFDEKFGNLDTGDDICNIKKWNKEIKQFIRKEIEQALDKTVAIELTTLGNELFKQGWNIYHAGLIDKINQIKKEL